MLGLVNFLFSISVTLWLSKHINEWNLPPLEQSSFHHEMSRLGASMSKRLTGSLWTISCWREVTWQSAKTLLHIQTGAKANSLSLPCASSCPVEIITNSTFFARPHNLGKNVACGNLLGTKKKRTHTHTHTVLDQEKGLWSLTMGGKPTRKHKTSFYNANCEERSGHWFGFRLISMLWCAMLSG